MRIAATFTTTLAGEPPATRIAWARPISLPTPGLGSTPTRCNHFLITHVEALRDVGQRVVFADDGLLHIHDIAAGTTGFMAVGVGKGGGGGGNSTTGGGALGAGLNSEQPQSAKAPMQTARVTIFMGPIYSKVGRSGN
jgi:hypothetical protein